MRIVGGFEIDIGEHQDVSGNARAAIPAAERLDIFLEQRITPWLKDIARNRLTSAEKTIDDDSTQLKVRYDAAKSNWGMSYPPFQLTSTPDKNTVFSGLKRKSRQLRDSMFCGPMGIFLCNGGCSLFREFEVPQNVKIDAVISHFFRQNTSVSFVAVVDIFAAGGQSRSVIRPNFEVRYSYYDNPNAHFNIQEGRVRHLLDRLLTLPRPESDVNNALSWLQYSPRRGRPYERFTETMDFGDVDHMTIKMSARLLLDVLSGQMTQSDFINQIREKQCPDPFNEARKAGMLIREMRMVQLPGEDDDIIEIELAGPDPAISSFIQR